MLQWVRPLGAGECDLFGAVRLPGAEDAQLLESYELGPVGAPVLTAALYGAREVVGDVRVGSSTHAAKRPLFDLR